MLGSRTLPFRAIPWAFPAPPTLWPSDALPIADEFPLRERVLRAHIRQRLPYGKKAAFRELRICADILRYQGHPSPQLQTHWFEGASPSRRNSHKWEI